MAVSNILVPWLLMYNMHSCISLCVRAVASIFNIPGMRLAPEMDELLRTHIRTNPHMKTKV